MNKQENNSRAYLVMFFLHVSTESIFHNPTPPSLRDLTNYKRRKKETLLETQ